MPNRILTTFVVSLACFFFGCRGNDTYVPVHITVLDAETTDPVPNVDINIGYTHWMTGGPFVTPDSSKGTTDQDGIARLLFAYDQNPVLTVITDEYIERDYGFHGHTDGAFDHYPPDEPAFVTVKLWKAPIPIIEVEVPDNYRGWLTVRIDETLPRISAPHFRIFKSVALDGQANIPYAEVLEVFDITHYVRATWSSGGEIPYPSRKDADIRYWPLPRTEPYFSVGLIGTAEEQEAVRKVLYPGDLYSREGFANYSELVRSRVVPKPHVQAINAKP